jgi:hypothetical protein
MNLENQHNVPIVGTDPFMKSLISSFLISCVVGLSWGCSSNNDVVIKEFGRRYMEGQYDYCSTNIFVAEQGVMDFRKWLLNTNNPTEPALNRDSALYEVDARLFLIEEYIGDTNKAEIFCQESLAAHNRYVQYVQSLHLPPEPHPLEMILSKDQLLERLARENKDLKIGWMKQIK